MSLLKIMTLILLIMPFLFVFGIMASSADILCFSWAVEKHILLPEFAVCGKGLERATREAVYMEMDIIRQIIEAIFRAGYFRGSDRFCKLKSLIGRHLL